MAKLLKVENSTLAFWSIFLVALFIVMAVVTVFSSMAELISLARIVGILIVAGSITFVLEEFGDKSKRNIRRFKSVTFFVGCLVMLIALILGIIMLYTGALVPASKWFIVIALLVQAFFVGRALVTD